MEILEKGEPAIIFLAILLGLGLSNIPLLTANRIFNNFIFMFNVIWAVSGSST